MNEERERALGDGIYASFDGRSLKILDRRWFAGGDQISLTKHNVSKLLSFIKELADGAEAEKMRDRAVGQ